MLSLDKAIKSYEKIAEENEKDAEQFKRIKATEDIASYCYECAKEHRQLAKWLRDLKWYREDTRFADLYESICIKRDEDRDYFARTKDKTYLTRIAEKEMFIHMMQDMMFDRYGVEEVNADEDCD